MRQTEEWLLVCAKKMAISDKLSYLHHPDLHHVYLVLQLEDSKNRLSLSSVNTRVLFSKYFGSFQVL